MTDEAAMFDMTESKLERYFGYPLVRYAEADELVLISFQTRIRTDSRCEELAGQKESENELQQDSLRSL